MLYNHKIVILGGGIAGLTTAIALAKKGFSSVSIFERKKALLNQGAGVVLWPNASSILSKLMNSSTVFEKVNEIKLFQQYTPTGNLINSIPVEWVADKMGSKAYPVLRYKLLQALEKEALSYGIKVHYSHNTKTIYPEKQEVLFENNKTITYDILLGADGRMNSIVRKEIVGSNQPRNLGYINWVGKTDYSNIKIEKASIKDFAGDRKRFAIVPINAQQVYWAGCIPIDLQQQKPKEKDKEYLIREFSKWDSTILKIIELTESQQVRKIEVYDHDPLNHWYKGKICMIGDAAHAAAPTTGQGACQAIEDAWWLAFYLAESTTTVEQAFKSFQDKRINKTQKIIQLGRDSVQRLFFQSKQEETQVYSKERGLNMAKGMVQLWSS